MENLGMTGLFGGIYRGKRVFLTGHTGFKGSWLAFWLHRMGAEVTGYALAPETDPNHFSLVSPGMNSILGDIRDRAALEKALFEASPEIVFHLAAQPLVRRSYRNPWKRSTPTSWEPPTCWRPAARLRPSGRSWLSPPTSATKTVNGSGDTGKTTPWAATTRTAHQRAAPNF